MCLCYLIKYFLNIVLRQDTCGPICFKLCNMLDTIKLYNMSPVWITLTFSQDHSVVGKLDPIILLQSYMKQAR